jgi:predicted Zn-dependent peptidase
MYEDDPNWRVFFNLLDGFFNEHPVKKDIAGTIETISHINRDILYKCFNTFYNPSNMVIVAGGDIEPQEVFESVEKLIRVKDAVGEIKRIYPNEKQEINKDYIEQTMEVSIPLFYMGYKDIQKKYDSKDILKREVAMKILLEMFFGRSSEIYDILYKKGLINASFGFDYTLEANYAYSMIGGESPDPMEVKKLVLAEIEHLKNVGIDVKNFDRIKKMMRGRFIRSLNSVDKICRGFLGTYFNGVNVFDYYEVYDTLDCQSTQKIFLEHFAPERLVISVVKPLKE